MILTDVTNIGDPMILLHDGTYYAYMTDMGADGGCTEGFFVRESKDLIHWSPRRQCFAPADGWGENSYWAPEVVYHRGKFVMHYSSRSQKLHSLRLGVCVSDSPYGPFHDVHGGPMFDLGYSTIDGSVLRCEKGNFLYYSRDCGENVINGVHTSQVYCVRLNDDLAEAVGEHRLMTTPEHPYELKSLNLGLQERFIWNEGPCVIEYAGRYLMNYSANFYATNDYSICMAVADDPMGPWKKPEENPVFCCSSGMFGAGHNFLFRDKEGALRTSFHIQTHSDSPGGNRQMVIGRVNLTVDENGKLHQEITD